MAVSHTDWELPKIFVQTIPKTCFDGRAVHALSSSLDM